MIPDKILWCLGQGVAVVVLFLLENEYNIGVGLAAGYAISLLVDIRADIS
jgi:hypothetical protein